MRYKRGALAALILAAAVVMHLLQPIWQARRMEERAAFAQALLAEEGVFIELLDRMEKEEKWRVLEETEWAGICSQLDGMERMSWYPEEKALFLMMRTGFPAAQGYFLSRTDGSGEVLPDHIRMQPLGRGTDIVICWREEGWD